MDNVQSLMEKNSELFRQAYNEKIQIWLDHVFLTWRWWIGAAVIVLCLLIWFRLRKQESADRLFYAGSFTAILTTFLNLTGLTFGLWEYRYELLPAEAYIPWDFFLLPTVIMLLLLFKPHINPWFKAIFLGVLVSFVGLPMLSWLGLYEPINWNYIYSFPIMMVIYFLAHFISRRNIFSK
ncbi:CBO0543 family protein [Alkalihalobacillus deserti]|uniref:CBO0543 family protein n=1 Tax=Alkalihalobacillus deserti TaxID=2879466 RepID=UPI001D138138|nr:CBO0543 family protein [Alkalihalobacillus deserti]